MVTITEPCIDHGAKGYGLGYATSWITYEGRHFTTTRHRKVHYEATGEWPEVVEHLCNNARCINPEHLRAGTHKSNSEYKHKSGRAKVLVRQGAANGRAIVSDADCESIRALYVRGSRNFGSTALARRFGIGTSQVFRILNGVRQPTAERLISLD